MTEVCGNCGHDRFNHIYWDEKGNGELLECHMIGCECKKFTPQMSEKEKNMRLTVALTGGNPYDPVFKPQNHSPHKPVCHSASRSEDTEPDSSKCLNERGTNATSGSHNQESLSDKIINPITIVNPKTKVIWDKDVKEAVKKLKKELGGVCGGCPNINFEKEIDSIFGEKLI